MVIFQIYSGSDHNVIQYIASKQCAAVNKEYASLQFPEQGHFYSLSLITRSGNYIIIKMNIFLSITKNEPAVPSTYMQTRLFHSKTTLSKGGLLNCGKFVVR